MLAGRTFPEGTQAVIVADVGIAGGARTPSELLRYDHLKLSPANGSVRMRLPVAAKIALHTAGAAAGRPGSPKPVGGADDFTKCTSTTGGDWFMRINGY